MVPKAAYRHSKLASSLLAAILVSSSAFSQQISNVRATVEGVNVTVTYDLQRTSEDETFDVFLYSSINNFTLPIEKATGDVGPNIEPGTGKSMQWNASSELVSYRGEVVFEVRVQVFIPYVTFNNPGIGTSMRRGAGNTFIWNGGLPTDRVELELFKGFTKIRTIETVQNQGQFSWTLPQNLKPGKDYSIKLTNTEDSNQVGVSESFVIKRKIPLLLKIVVPLAIGSVIPFLIPKADKDLPNPPGPGSN